MVFTLSVAFSTILDFEYAIMGDGGERDGGWEGGREEMDGEEENWDGEIVPRLEDMRLLRDIWGGALVPYGLQAPMGVSPEHKAQCGPKINASECMCERERIKVNTMNKPDATHNINIP